jgi:hypothetical protein
LFPEDIPAEGGAEKGHDDGVGGSLSIAQWEARARIGASCTSRNPFRPLASLFDDLLRSGIRSGRRPSMTVIEPGRFLVLVVIPFMLAAPAARAQDLPVISECGQHIRSGRLAANLDCSASGGHAVVIGGGTLELGGFTVTADASGAFDAVRCIERCEIAGPGDIAGGVHGIHVTFESTPPVDVAFRLETSDVRVSGAIDDGIYVYNGRAIVRDAVVEENGRCGIHASDVTLIDSTIRNNACGVLAQKRAKVAQSTFESNRTDAMAAAGFGIGVSAPKVRVKDSTLSGHLVGDATTTGSRCEVLGCGDIRTFGRRPKLKGVSCEVSVNTVPQIDSSTTWTVATWNLCADDSDFDRDGTPNETDTCDANPTCSTADADGDGRGDCCDNCPDAANYFQSDDDLDGTGNACE